MSKSSAVLERFSAHIKRQSINPQEVFEEYDSRRLGLLHPNIFIRAIWSTNFYCTEDECQFLFSKYDDNGKVNYIQFIKDIKNFGTTMLPDKNNNSSTDIIEFGLMLQLKNLTVVDVLVEYDKVRVGRVSESNFYRAFGSSPLVVRVAKQYIDSITHDVDYMTMQKDIQNALANRRDVIAEPKTPLPEFFDNFVRCVVARNLNLHEIFIEYDRYKRGIVSLHDFISVMMSFGIPLSPEQLQNIATPFLDSESDENVDYRSFAAAVKNRSLSFAPPALNRTLNDNENYFDNRYRNTSFNNNSNYNNSNFNTSNYNHSNYASSNYNNTRYNNQNYQNPNFNNSNYNNLHDNDSNYNNAHYNNDQYNNYDYKNSNFTHSNINNSPYRGTNAGDSDYNSNNYNTNSRSTNHGNSGSFRYSTSTPYHNYNDVSDLEVVLEEIRKQVIARRINLREQLMQALEEGRGKLMRQRFYKIMGFEGFKFSDADLNAIDNAFVMNDETFDVDSFVNRVDPYEPKNEPVDIERLIYRLKSHLLETQRSISKYFVSFDREVSGTVSLSQLISAFNGIDFHPTMNELTALANHFGNGRFIQWKQLVEAVEPVLEKPPFLQTAVRSQFSGDREEPSHEAIYVMKKLYQSAQRCNVDIKNDLMRKDLRKCGLVNSRALRDELFSLPSTKLTNTEFVIATKAYFKPNTDMFCYPEFCQDLEKYGSIPDEAPVDDFQKIWQDLKEKNSQESVKTNEALHVLKAALMLRRISVDEMFFDIDKRKSGIVPNEAVLNAFKPLSVYVNDDQINQIMKEYCDRRQPEKFNYKLLCIALNEIVPTDEELNYVSNIRKTLNGVDEGIQMITNLIKNKLVERKKNVYDLFLNVYSEMIPASQFRSRIEQAGIIISEKEMEKLIRKYKGSFQNLIDWQKFCSDVSESQPIKYTSFC
ncbi:hypothetical protein TRFO_38884 [Tritrichomonas foetus]|uniref:EF-hand domain-containing protein n=1 Tax=Tritrichomonas foetus TaxID=1144522 RepID=A0A1J4J6T0_9EUKA|nr:hypothetical protein TRFO_38884 [Tritrichomonas foetus]|eukprot:OHS94938.1 hypothetical protein TRFO_38884 [Tritrichomonas foetus]